MTDQELDLLLAVWNIAEPSDKLRERAIAGFRAKERRQWPRLGRRLVWAAGAAVVSRRGFRANSPAVAGSLYR